MTSTTVTSADLFAGSNQSDQTTLQPADDNKKRIRPKNVTWASEDKLNQVCLFAAEDAPSLSGVLLQDHLEARKSKFMHTLTPVSDDDIPPGFEGLATKRAKIDSTAILAMVPQITWQLPIRFHHDPLWQVAMGDETSESEVQQQRELGVLEAIYPRSSAVPSSSIEPSEETKNHDDAQVLEIPLIPTEEDDVLEENHTLGAAESATEHVSKDSISENDASSPYPPDPDVAAAAAAAYAVVKAKESGALIDHELLIKILNNPLLIETLTASNPSLKKQIGEGTSIDKGKAVGNGLKIQSEQPRERSLLGTVGQLNPVHAHGRQIFDAAGGIIGQPWGLPMSQGRGFMPGPNDMSGQPRGAYVNAGQPARPPPLLCQDSRGIPQNAMPSIITNDAQVRQSATTSTFDDMFGHDVEQYRTGRPWLKVNMSAPPSHGLGKMNIAPHERPGMKTKRPCFFFNTPKGCRNGIYCNFSHDPTPEREAGERLTNDGGQGMNFAARDNTTTGEAQ
ncbi:hypothetical protein KP509_02G113100 [Ceratopteris richardii]|uniref:C3H1-type domain-containing protein n=2 Tax=Ceratopteris richardii TaxID=49495 RepID=A0A8T2V9P5_CERRI|nr:hypothetical protein KP509_02G113100 [Ceratopteris richardii]